MVWVILDEQDPDRGALAAFPLFHAVSLTTPRPQRKAL
jgi:hypothetical protein